MRTLTLRRCGVVLLAALLVAAFAGVASSVTYNLRVAMDNVTMPDNVVVPVWKIANVDTDNVLRFPGPVLEVTLPDVLEITLQNGLPDNISVVIPGQPMPLDNTGALLPPAFNVFTLADNTTQSRVHSYTAETAAGGSRTYRFTNLKEGTYRYESGTDPSVQVQMGLYGALIVRTAPGVAYGTAVAVDNVLLLYSEIDPALHNAVADNTYGTADFPSTIVHTARYALVNGRPYQNQLDPLGQPDPLIQHHTPFAIGPAGATTLVRFVNAGLRTHVPTIPDTTVLANGAVSVIAEDGNPLPFPRLHQTLLLPAGKTMDVLVVPAAPARKIPLFDRRLHVNNAGTYPGGMISFLAPVGADVLGPVTLPGPVPPEAALGISPVILTASAADNTTGNSNVVAAEWMTDNTVREGYGNPMAGTFGTPEVADLTGYVPLSAIPADNTIWIRSEDAEGNWSLPVPVTLVKGAAGAVGIVETDFVGGDVLIVRATSNAPAGTAALTVVCDGVPCGGAPAPTPLVYRSGINLYEAEVPRLPAKPDTVTVSGAGGSATAPVPFP